ncbi:MAG: ferredoxin reductase, partial [Alphaproteobacteria bacterium]
MTRANLIKPPVVIIGAGYAGAHCATALRRAGYDGPIRLIGAEEFLPYDRPPLSKAWLKDETTIARLTLRPADFYADRDIAVMCGRRVTAIMADEHRIRLDDGTMLDYHALVLAPGAAPRMLPDTMVGAEDGDEAARARMLSLRELADAR